MIAVLDVSAAVEILLQRPSAPALGERLAEAEWVLVPSLYTAELCNVFWKYNNLHGLPRELCEQSIAQGLALPDTFADDRQLQLEAFGMSCRCKHAVYDMLYLVLARRHSAQLLTMDRVLKRLAGQHDVAVE